MPPWKISDASVLPLPSGLSPGRPWWFRFQMPPWKTGRCLLSVPIVVFRRFRRGLAAQTGGRLIDCTRAAHGGKFGYEKRESSLYMQLSMLFMQSFRYSCRVRHSGKHCFVHSRAHTSVLRTSSHRICAAQELKGSLLSEDLELLERVRPGASAASVCDDDHVSLNQIMSHWIVY